MDEIHKGQTICDVLAAQNMGFEPCRTRKIVPMTKKRHYDASDRGLVLDLGLWVWLSVCQNDYCNGCIFSDQEGSVSVKFFFVRASPTTYR